MITAAISYLIAKNALNHNIYTRELAEQGALLTHDKDENVLTVMQLDDVIEQNFKKINPNMFLGDMLHNAVAHSTRNLFPVGDENEALVGIVRMDDPFVHESLVLPDGTYLQSKRDVGKVTA